MYCWYVFSMQRRGEERRKKEKREGKWEGGDIFFLPPWQYGAWDLFRVRRRRGEGRAWEGGMEEKDWKEEKIQRKQSKKNVNMVSKFQTKDTKQHSTFLSLTLPSLSLESSDCGRLPSNQNPVETVSERPREKSMHDKSGPPNRHNQLGCLCLTVLHGMRRVVSFKINQQYNLHRPAEIHLHSVCATELCGTALLLSVVPWKEPTSLSCLWHWAPEPLVPTEDVPRATTLSQGALNLWKQL